MTPPDARKTACDILNALDDKTSTLDLLISEKFDPVFQQMPRRDRNFAYALIYGVLRMRSRLDWIISRFSKKPAAKIDPVVLNILRIALFQIFFMDRVPPSAAVNTAVDLSKQTSPPWVVRFVNGLLRNVQRGRENIVWPDKNKDPLLWLSVEYAFPTWMLKRWVDRFGFENVEALCRFYNTPPPLSIRTNTLNVSRDDVTAALLPAAERVVPAPYAPEGLLVYGLKPAVHEVDAFKKGWFQVQDEAAQLVSHAVAPLPGDRVLDACAGLGGKTGHLAQLMNNTGTLVAMDTHSGRMKKLGEQMDRLGIAITSVLHHDLNHGLDPKHRLLYDRVLIDAPCSGTGVIRRNPDTKWSEDPKGLARYRENQLRYMDSVSSALKPGGILVYAVCSIEPEETVDVVSGFLKRHPEYAIAPLPGIFDPFTDMPEKPCTFTAIPHVHQMDGHFIAVFKKRV